MGEGGKHPFTVRLRVLIYLCSILWVELEGGQARADTLMS